MNDPRSQDDALRAQFERLLATDQQPGSRKPAPAADQPQRREESMRRHGTVSGVAGRDVFVDLGNREQGLISVREFAEPPSVGDRFEFQLVDFKDELWILSRTEARRFESYKTLTKGAWTKAVIVGHNTGGFEADVGPVRGFIPFSHMDRSTDEPESLVGENMVVEVLEVDPEKDRLLLSRRKVVEEERRKRREASLQTLAVGAVLRGVVEKVESFGAFLTLADGVTGLLHISEWSHERQESMESLVEVGQDMEVKVLEITEGGRRISLSRKALLQHPWDGVARRYCVDQLVTGRVTRVAEYGAFLELEQGVEGLVHVSQLHPDRVRRVGDHANKGDSLEVRIVSIDEDARRISLSRLSASGALLGSEEDVTYDDVDPQLLPRPQSSGSEVATNLGSLLIDALNKPGSADRNSKKRHKKKKR
jgi:small subunit ribosomal protein S1